VKPRPSTGPTRTRPAVGMGHPCALAAPALAGGFRCPLATKPSVFVHQRVALCARAAVDCPCGDRPNLRRRGLFVLVCVVQWSPQAPPPNDGIGWRGVLPQVHRLRGEDHGAGVPGCGHGHGEGAGGPRQHDRGWALPHTRTNARPRACASRAASAVLSAPPPTFAGGPGSYHSFFRARRSAAPPSHTLTRCRQHFPSPRHPSGGTAVPRRVRAILGASEQSRSIQDIPDAAAEAAVHAAGGCAQADHRLPRREGLLLTTDCPFGREHGPIPPPLPQLHCGPPPFPHQKTKSKLSREDGRHLNSLARSVLFVELFFGFQPDTLVERALRAWQKELQRVSGGISSPLEVCVRACVRARSRGSGCRAHGRGGVGPRVWATCR
jgi:hypothetical protein